MLKVENWLSKEFRLEKYLGRLSNPDNHMFRLCDQHVRNFNIDKIIATSPDTASPQIESLKDRMPYNFDDYFGLCIMGDMGADPGFPSLVKARPLNRYSNNSNNIISFANLTRHWGPVQQILSGEIQDIPWKEKKSKAVWRGALTHKFSTTNSRLLLLKEFYNHKLIDVGFTEIFWSSKIRPEFMKPFLSIQEQLSYKYLISIEGHDVATNLQWAMCSNSVVLMPMPQCESWFLESCLIPWVHFVPISETMDDLEDKIAWCIDNDNRCQEIVKNANDYVSNFLDFEAEKRLESLVIQNYFDRLTFTCDEHLKKEFPTLLENKKNVVVE